MSKALPPPIQPVLPAWSRASLTTGLAVDPVAVPIMVRDGAPHPAAPAVEPYHFDTAIVRELSWAVWPHDGGPPSPVVLTGPKGAGKTSLIEQLAARAGVPLYRVNLNCGTTVAHLKGHRGVRDGETVFYPGVVTRAMEEGAWLLLDEVSGASPNVTLALFPVLEPGGAVYLEEAEPPRWVQRHPDFRVFCTDNVIGGEQEEGRYDYTGTNPDTNTALLDRIHSTINVGYLAPSAEHAAVKGKYPHIDDVDIEIAVRVAMKVRQEPSMPGFSTRMVIEWARRIAAGRLNADGSITPFGLDGVLEAARYAFLNKMPSKADADAVAGLIRRMLADGGGRG